MIAANQLNGAEKTESVFGVHVLLFWVSVSLCQIKKHFSVLTESQ